YAGDEDRDNLAADERGDVARRRAEGGADAELAGPAGGAVRDDAVDAERGKQQGDRAEQADENRVGAAWRDGVRDDVLHHSDVIYGLARVDGADSISHPGEQLPGRQLAARDEGDVLRRV